MASAIDDQHRRIDPSTAEGQGRALYLMLMRLDDNDTISNWIDGCVTSRQQKSGAFIRTLTQAVFKACLSKFFMQHTEFSLTRFLTGNDALWYYSLRHLICLHCIRCQDLIRFSRIMPHNILPS